MTAASGWQGGGSLQRFAHLGFNHFPLIASLHVDNFTKLASSPFLTVVLTAKVWRSRLCRIVLRSHEKYGTGQNAIRMLPMNNNLCHHTFLDEFDLDLRMYSSS